LSYRLTAMTAPFTAQVAGWRYPPPYDTYDLGPEDMSHLLQAEHRYHVVWDGDDVVGYCCFGVDATVPGGDYSRDALDVGWGMRPALVGHGRGSGFVAAIVGFAAKAYAPPRMRVTIAEFNERSQRAAARNGFTVETGRFAGPDGMRFMVLERADEPPRGA
jgi:[ribosomal protein S18]-alanine N-acetyltransferase